MGLATKTNKLQTVLAARKFFEELEGKGIGVG